VALILNLLVIAALVLLAIKEPKVAARLSRENDLVEWLQVLLTGAAGAIAMRHAWQARRAGQPFALEVAIVASMTIVCIGEVALDRVFFDVRLGGAAPAVGADRVRRRGRLRARRDLREADRPHSLAAEKLHRRGAGTGRGDLHLRRTRRPAPRYH
jgi:hypothetical protein